MHPASNYTSKRALNMAGLYFLVRF